MELYEHNPGDHEDPLHGPLWIVGLLGAVLLTVVVLGLTALFYVEQTEEVDEKVVERDPKELQTLRSEQQSFIHGEPRWMETIEPDANGTDQLTQKLVIPIEDAMEIVAKEYSQ